MVGDAGIRGNSSNVSDFPGLIEEHKGKAYKEEDNSEEGEPDDAADAAAQEAHY